jgi:TATA-box binding protein (TBP) (component of TFIID and TFIIIB)
MNYIHHATTVIHEEDYLDESDYELIKLIKSMESAQMEARPEPTPYKISTHTTTCYYGNPEVTNCDQNFDFGYIVKHLAKRIIEDNFLSPVEHPFFQGLVSSNITIRFDADIYKKTPSKKNTVAITEKYENPETGEITSKVTEYFDTSDLEKTRVELTSLLASDAFQYVKNNGKQKREEEKRKEKMEYEKKNVVITYNLTDLPEGSKVGTGLSSTESSLREKEKKATEEKGGIQVLDEGFDPVSDLSHLQNHSMKYAAPTGPKQYEHMYNSCSIIIKPAPHIKAVNLKLFCNGQISITGSLQRDDGYKAAEILLEELKRHPAIFLGIARLDQTALTKSAKKKTKIYYPLPTEDYIEKLEIRNYTVTLINATFKTNFAIDLIELLNRLYANEEKLFVEYDPNTHRGIQINYFINPKNPRRDGVCYCTRSCFTKRNQKKSHSTFDEKNEINIHNKEACSKVTICIFKTGSVGLIGGNYEEHTQEAYEFINGIFEKYYADIVKVSMDDVMKEKKVKKGAFLLEMIKQFDEDCDADRESPTQKEAKVEAEAKVEVKARSLSPPEVTTYTIKESYSSVPTVVKKDKPVTKIMITPKSDKAKSDKAKSDKAKSDKAKSESGKKVKIVLQKA